MTSYLFMQMIIGLFFSLSWVQKIWKKSVSTFIISNMMMIFIVLHNIKEDAYGYAVVTTCLCWLYYRAIFKKGDDKWLMSDVKIQFKED